MKFDIARQPLVPAFLTLFALALTAMCAPAVQFVSAVAGPGAAANEVARAGSEAVPLLGGLLARFQASYPGWSQLLAGFIILFTGMCTGRITIRYNLYTVGTCLAIPLYAIIACGIFIGPDYLAGFTASMMLALAGKNYCRSFCNGYGFDAIFRASLYLGALPLVYVPALPLLLLLPLALVLFRRTLREVAVSLAGVLLPVLTLCYAGWGAGDAFQLPFLKLGNAFMAGIPLQVFRSMTLSTLIMSAGIVVLDLAALFFFLSDIYAAGTKSRFVLIYIIGMLLLTLAVLFTPAATAGAFALFAVPSAVLLPVLFVRIHRGLALPLYLILLVAAAVHLLLQ